MNRPFSLTARPRKLAAAAWAVVFIAGSAGAQTPTLPGSAGPAPPSHGDSNAGAERPAAERSEDPNVERAREAFRLGSTLARQGQWQDALSAYERSAELRPHAVTTYNIGYVERALGHLTDRGGSWRLPLSHPPALAPNHSRTI